MSAESANLVEVVSPRGYSYDINVSRTLQARKIILQLNFAASVVLAALGLTVSMPLALLGAIGGIGMLDAVIERSRRNRWFKQPDGQRRYAQWLDTQSRWGVKRENHETFQLVRR